MPRRTRYPRPPLVGPSHPSHSRSSIRSHHCPDFAPDIRRQSLDHFLQRLVRRLVARHAREAEDARGIVLANCWLPAT
jgi:hypothetical protein